MPQIFHRSFNTLSRLSVVAAVLVAGVAGAGAWVLGRSPFYSNVGVTSEQPVPFSHEHHVTGLGIDCRYCHDSVEDSSFAGMPPTKTCMNCHSQIWLGSPLLEPVRESFRTGKSLQWNRVHLLADFVYFDHSIHVQKGVGCVTCHGQVDKMPLMWQHSTLLMEWCLDCHRQPEQYLRPRDKVFDMNWKPADQVSLGKELKDKYHVRDADILTSCSTCHR